jgi:NAD(P)-dependent dehydrogenase (short-subunit alcohol dehydrogenase family)
LHVLITGGSRGIGAAVARLAGARGWDVSVNYVADAEAATLTVRDVAAAGGRAVALKGDAAAEPDVRAMWDAAEAAFGQVGGFVNNAGIVAPAARLAEMDLARMERVLRTNVVGALLGAREAARRMARSAGGAGGAIVNVSSVAAVLGAPAEYVDYAASKGAVDTLTVGLARGLAADGVRVNGIRPGLIATDIHASGGRPDRVAALAPSVPMGRGGTAKEAAEAVVWLLSDAASYVTGATIDVAGGR